MNIVADQGRLRHYFERHFTDFRRSRISTDDHLRMRVHHVDDKVWLIALVELAQMQRGISARVFSGYWPVADAPEWAQSIIGGAA